MRWHVALAVVCATAAAAVSPGTAWPQGANFEDTISKFFHHKGRTAPHSLAVSISRDGALVFSSAYGESAPGVPAHEETIYHIGSLTKQFTAAAILKLVEGGAIVLRTGRPLALDSEVSGILPGFEHWSKSSTEPVTVRRLLNMTSNLPNFTRRPPGEADPWGAVGSAELLGAMKSYEPRGWPDSFEYSNTGYFLLAEIMDAAGKKPGGGALSYERVLRSLFEAAGMRSTGFMRDVAGTQFLAKPHYDRKPAFIMGDWLKGSGDMASTAMDLFFWNKALMEGRVLPTSVREHLFAEGGRISPTIWYGMGFVVEHKNGRDEFTHTGAVPGYSSFNGIYRDERFGRWASVTLLTNSGGLEGLDSLGSDLADLVLRD